MMAILSMDMECYKANITLKGRVCISLSHIWMGLCSLLDSMKETALMWWPTEKEEVNP